VLRTSLRRATLAPLAGALALCALASCGSSRRGTTAPIGATIGTGDYAGVAWPQRDWIVVSVDPHSGLPGWQLWRMHPDGSGKSPIALPSIPGCNRSQDTRLSSLGDGRVVVLRTCTVLNSRPAGVVDVLAVDPASGHTTVLVPTMEFGPKQVAWSLALQRGLADQNSGICATIAAIDVAGAHYLPIRLNDFGQSWRLDDPAFVSGAECDSTGRLGFPAIAPDGHSVALLESATPGVVGAARLDHAWFLTSVDLRNLGPPTPLGALTVSDPRSMSWGATGVLFAGLVGSRGGVWLYHPEVRTPRMVASGNAVDGQLSPDGLQAIVLLEDANKGDDPPMRILRTYQHFAAGS
jgi:hypothetical protein